MDDTSYKFNHTYTAIYLLEQPKSLSSRGLYSRLSKLQNQQFQSLPQFQPSNSVDQQKFGSIARCEKHHLIIYALYRDHTVSVFLLLLMILTWDTLLVNLFFLLIFMPTLAILQSYQLFSLVHFVLKLYCFDIPC